MSGFEKGKLSQEQIDEIIQDIHSGKSKTEVAEKFAIDRSTIYHYLNNQTTKRTTIIPEIRKKIIEDLKDKTKTCQSIAEKHGVKLSTVLYYSARGVRRNDKKKVKNYADYLKEENEKRKARGLYQFKNGLAKEKAFGYNYK